MSKIRASVKRESTARFSLFGPERWWGVYLTPFQQVAAFPHFYDAMTWAALITVNVRHKAKAKEGTE